MCVSAAVDSAGFDSKSGQNNGCEISILQLPCLTLSNKGTAWKTSSDGRVVRASASGAVDSGLIPSRVKPMTLELVYTAFPASRSALKGQCGEQAGKFTCCAVGKGT